MNSTLKTVLILLIILCVLITGLYFKISDDKKEIEEAERIFNKSMELWRENESYRQETMRVVTTGIPINYTCEQIRFMIMSEVYPPYEVKRYCKNYPEGEEMICSSWYDPNTKETFVKYYLTECLEQKDAKSVGDDQ